MGKKYPYYGKSMINNFPGSPHTMGFVAFSHAMGNWWENPCISHMMRFVNFFLWIVYKIFKYLKKGLLQGSTTARGHTFSSMQHDKLERDGDNKSYTDKCQKHIDTKLWVQSLSFYDDKSTKPVQTYHSENSYLKNA